MGESYGGTFCLDVGEGGSVSKTFKRQGESRKYEGNKREEVIRGRSGRGRAPEDYTGGGLGSLSLSRWACWPGSGMYAEEEGTSLIPGARSISF